MRVRFYIMFISLMLPSLLLANDSIVGKFVKTWRVIDRFATVDSIPVDTAFLNFQNDNHIDKLSIANSYRGNLGSPIQSKLYFNRPEQHDFIFSDGYYPYINQIESATFYNTNMPFSNLYFITGGTNYYEDEQIRFLFTANANKKFNFGGTLDYLYARGEYKNLASKRFAGSLFGTIDTKKYKATFHASMNEHTNYENGGIQDTMYINGSINYPPYNIPVNINGYSNYRQNQLFYNHQYNIGIERAIRMNEDSVRFEYVPVTIFSHTIQVDDMRKRYFEPDVEKEFYENTYTQSLQTNDTASLFMVTNRVAVSLAEEFNKWMKFGLTAYIENDIRKYGYLTDTLFTHQSESNTRAGGVLSKNQGKFLRYNIAGELNFLGEKAGDFLLNANLGTYFNVWNQEISVVGKGYIKSQEPSHFLKFYDSNHFRWRNNFDKTLKSHIGGTFAVPTLGFKFDMTVENITDYIYFNSNALPEQFSGNIQVVGADLKQDFHLGKFTLENNVIYQLSSHQDILPLPELSLYHNLYFHDLWFDVLSMQLGVDVRYHTSYYAPTYMPATSQFYIQKDVMIGNYPVMNVYLNAHLKRTRFFIQYYHVNQLFMKGDYYSMPKYPLYPSIFKMGLSWNFYD